MVPKYQPYNGRSRDLMEDYNFGLGIRRSVVVKLLRYEPYILLYSLLELYNRELYYD